MFSNDCMGFEMMGWLLARGSSESEPAGDYNRKAAHAVTIRVAAANADTRTAHISSDLPDSGGAPGTSGPTVGTGGRSTLSLMS
jgi:hypothetical protein